MVAKIELSVVIPVFNEEKNINPLYKSLKKVMDGLNKSYEIIFIDDGSKDKTFSVLRSINKKDKKLKVIKFRINSGKTAALSAGFNLAKGKIVITMDGDLQNDSHDIPILLKKIKEGYDVVSGWRKYRKDPFFSKNVPSKISNWLASRFTGVKIHDFNCPFKAYKRESLKNIKLFGEMHRYIPALTAFNGFSVTEVKVKHYPRKYGKSKYGFGRLIKGFLDLIYLVFWSTYSTRPLHFFGLLGFFQIISGFLIAISNLLYYSIKRGTLKLGIGPILLLAVVLIILGVQFIVLGFLGEILIRTYYKDTEEKGYIIEKILQMH